MNNLMELWEDIEKADAIMYAIENTYLDLAETTENTQEKIDRGVSMFYVLWDVIHKALKEIENLVEEENE